MQGALLPLRLKLILLLYHLIIPVHIHDTGQYVNIASLATQSVKSVAVARSADIVAG